MTHPVATAAHYFTGLSLTRPTVSQANSTLNTPTASSSTVKVYEVTKADLPLSCPGKFMTLWNMHPKVYLPIEKTGHAGCPYCGAQYKLVG